MHFYQLAIPAPRSPAGSFDTSAFERGKVLFEGKARCATCHVPPLYTEPGNNLHAPAEIGPAKTQIESHAPLPAAAPISVPARKVAAISLFMNWYNARLK